VLVPWYFGGVTITEPRIARVSFTFLSLLPRTPERNCSF
jgi:hypothetical protein